MTTGATIAHAYQCLSHDRLSARSGVVPRRWGSRGAGAVASRAGSSMVAVVIAPRLLVRSLQGGRTGPAGRARGPRAPGGDGTPAGRSGTGGRRYWTV